MNENKVRISITIDKSVKEDLDVFIKDHFSNQSRIVNESIKQFLDNQK